MAACLLPLDINVISLSTQPNTGATLLLLVLQHGAVLVVLCVLLPLVV